MGMTFSVGNPSDAFTEPFAGKIRAMFARQFGSRIVLDSAEEPYYSEELGWSGWRLLQERASTALTAGRVPSLLSMEAWSGCYVPVDLEPGAYEFEDESTTLAVASLGRLVAELEAFGAAIRLPVDVAGLRDLATDYQDDDSIDEDMDIQTYAQLLLAAREAMRRKQVLWVVK